MEIHSLDKKIPAAAVADKEFDRSVRFGHCKFGTARAKTAQSTNVLLPSFVPDVVWAPFATSLGWLKKAPLARIGIARAKKGAVPRQVLL
jgi:hypothetical protein